MNYKGINIEIIKTVGFVSGVRRHIKATRWNYKFTWTNSETGKTNYLGTSHKAEPLKRDALKNAKYYADYIASKKDFYKI